jgi:hypothetical protein
VELVQSTAQFPDISGLATKNDLASKVTKTDLAELAHTIKMDIQALRTDLAIAKTQILVELDDKLRFQSFVLLGWMTIVVGLATAIITLGS